MLGKLLKEASYVILSIALISLISFTGWSSAYAISIQGQNGNNPLGIVIEPSNSNQNPDNTKLLMDEINMEELFGSEQVFPFEAGFGKD